jgi:hypothetical protein
MLAAARLGSMELTVRTAGELVAAAGDAAVALIAVAGHVSGVPPVRLAAGQRLTGMGEDAAITFLGDGVELDRDNQITGLRLHADPAHRAIHAGTADLGTLLLHNVTATGQVQLLARTGHAVVDGLDVVVADLRDRTERPSLLGVEVMQGAFTLWGPVTAELRGISAGRDGAPVRGSGVFVAGAEVSVLDTGPIVTDGGIAEGRHDLISGGVFVVTGARVAEVRNRGPVTTHGVNDMVLDNWGTVHRWTAEAPLTSYGRSGVGFVNFGAIGVLRIEAPVETFGVGARGFNVYRLDGHTGPTVDEVEFDRITTHADAAVGIQIGQPIGRLTVHNGVATGGGTGESLVRGEIVKLSAHALSVQPGGRVERVDVGGALTATGPGAMALDIRGEVVEMRVAGGIHGALYLAVNS